MFSFERQVLLLPAVVDYFGLEPHLFTQYVLIEYKFPETKLDGQSLTIAGWGRTNFSTKVTPRSLLKTQVEVVSNEDCREETLWKTRKRHSIEKHMFCAIGQSAKNGTLVRDACLVRDIKILSFQLF